MVKTDLEQLVQLRKELHKYPELAGQEWETARRIVNFLHPYKPDTLLEGIGGHGVAAIYNFGQEGPKVMIRCELDALPINEPNTFTYRSQRPGVAHKCGHDGHMTIVAGLAPWLQQKPFIQGTVILLFQPAEETGEGAIAVLKDPKFEMIQPDYVFALHNIPGIPLNRIVKVKRQFSATVQSVAILLQGLQSHAAEPEHGKNPAWAMADITQSIKKWIIADPDRPDFTLITPVYTTMGQPEYGISAGYGELHFTLRTWSISAMEDLVESLEGLVKSIAADYELSAELNFIDYFPATRNKKLANEWIDQAARAASFEIVEKQVPFKFGEDFGWFAQRYSGAMFGLGAGWDTPVLHNDQYDFPDELIEHGMAMFKGIIQSILKE